MNNQLLLLLLFVLLSLELLCLSKRHGRHEEIQDLRCQACDQKFTVLIACGIRLCAGCLLAVSLLRN